MGFLYMVVCSLLCLSLYMVVSKKFAVCLECSNVNFIVGCMLFARAMNASKVGCVPFQMNRMSSIYLIHRSSCSVWVLVSCFSISCMNMLA